MHTMFQVIPLDFEMQCLFLQRTHQVGTDHQNIFKSASVELSKCNRVMLCHYPRAGYFGVATLFPQQFSPAVFPCNFFPDNFSPRQFFPRTLSPTTKFPLDKFPPLYSPGQKLRGKNVGGKRSVNRVL